MCTAAVPPSASEALEMLQTLLGVLAGQDAADLPDEVLAESLRALERVDAVGAALRGRYLEAFDARDGHVADGQRTARTWLVHSTRVTRGQAAEHKAVQVLARRHPVLADALAEGSVLTKSVALQVARWTRRIPVEFRGPAEEIVVAAARAGADEQALAAICAEILYRTAPPDPADDQDLDLDRGVSFETTFDGAGVLRGDLTPQCAAMVQAVLDALSAPAGGGDLRTRPQRYHDALEEAMRRLLASGLLPRRAGQPVKALVHISFAELCDLDAGSALQDKLDRRIPGPVGCPPRRGVGGHRGRRRVAGGRPGPRRGLRRDDHPRGHRRHRRRRGGGADRLVRPLPPPAHRPRAGLTRPRHPRHHRHPRRRDGGPGSDGSDGGAVVPAGLTGGAAAQAGQAALVTAALAELEHQIVAKVLQVVSGPGGVASFLRRQLLGKGLNGPSLPLDVGQTDDIPVHLRRLVALRDQTCQHPGGCDQPAAGCEAHHVIHRQDGGRTSLTNLKDYCWWHHHVLLHQLGWTLTAHPDGTSQITSPDGKTIHSHSPPPDPG